jgi:hypothetical protein
MDLRFFARGTSSPSLETTGTDLRFCPFSAAMLGDRDSALIGEMGTGEGTGLVGMTGETAGNLGEAVGILGDALAVASATTEFVGEDFGTITKGVLCIMGDTLDTREDAEGSTRKG